MEIGLKHCAQGHIIYETCRTCPFCAQINNLGKSLLSKGNRVEVFTEVLNTIPAVEINKTRPKPGQNEAGADRTVFESDDYDKTRVEDTFTGDKTIMESDADKTILDESMLVPLPIQPFFAWLVFLGEDSQPIHDVRITRDKSVIGKGADADIRLNSDFASKLHALIYFEDGRFFLTDLGSTNHTFLNEKKVFKEELNDGDCIRIGRQGMIFKYVGRDL
jgi:hypothetical protein